MINSWRLAISARIPLERARAANWQRSVWRTCAILFLTLACACSPSQEKASERAAAAAALFDAGNYPEAHKAILDAIAERDDIADQFILQGRIELALNRADSAFGAYSRVLELDPSSQEALQFVAEYYLRAGLFKEAEKTADSSLSLDPRAMRPLLIKGMIALNRHDTAKALDFAEQLLKINPSDTQGLILKARAIAKSGDRAAALKLLEERIPPAGRNDDVILALMGIYRADGNLPGLLGTFEALVPKAADNVDLRIDYINTLYKSGNVARARSEVLGLMRSQGDNADALAQIVALWREYDADPLDRDALEWVKAKGTDATRLAIAHYLLSVERIAEAQAALARARTGAEGLFARLLAAQGQTERAREMANDILARDTNNADALLLRSELSLRTRDFRQAVNDAQLVVRDNPENEEGYLALAKAFVLKGETWHARQIFENGINTLPQNLVLVSRFVDFLFLIDDKKRAMSVAREFTEANPASLRGWDLLASVCTRVDDGNCSARAQAGRARALTIYEIDERPGTERFRNRLGRL